MTTPALRIFLVEDHADTRACFASYLEDLGHTVITATTLAEAVATLPAARCDLLLSDIGLADGLGWDLLNLAALPEPIYAVAMSGFGATRDPARYAKAGFQKYLIKPLTPEKIDQVLAEYFQQRATQP